MSKRDRMDEIVKHPTKLSSSTSGLSVLSQLFREILLKIGMTWDEWNRLMSDHLNNPRNGIQNNPRERTTERGNLNKFFSNKEMTWKSFWKAMIFLQPYRVDITVTLWRHGKETVTHQITKNIDSSMFGKTDDIDVND